ncbi:flagellar export protein FliJ [Alkalicoccus urumqiensis]|uniref:Flagellar FliJ protein n=1 Tax=Alkalicoccus urumqiensis TaxID=1548213 RepID=A0A2P6MG11_ALKUR|nr:flagellar export protein FliJ [Alkalicoccus urumqiensis]PRO65229.1 flagellar export protein FliJ [Alkalicoccus urumqiensis]
MEFRYSLQKVLELKDREKNVAATAYNEAAASFESCATELYDHLRKKEELENGSIPQNGGTISIMEMQQRQKQLDFLKERIQDLQVKTQKARRDMTDKERFLQMKAVDVKKYERMKVKEQEKASSLEKHLEQKFLDEISVQQYVRK